MNVKRILPYAIIYFSIMGLFACYFAPKQHLITFLEIPCIKPHLRYRYLTCERVEVLVDDKSIIIPESFDTDLASIPRWFWTFLSPAYSGFIAPSILHDYLYQCHNGYSRKVIDEIFYSALTENGVTRYTSLKMYAAVRIFGEFHYNKSIACLKD